MVSSTTSHGHSELPTLWDPQMLPLKPVVLAMEFLCGVASLATEAQAWPLIYGSLHIIENPDHGPNR